MSSLIESAPTPTQRFMAYSQRMSSDFDIVGIDHSYAKPWSSHPDASNARPIQMLFVEKFGRKSLLQDQRTEEELVDVDGEETNPPALYDISKAKAIMADCDRHASLLRPDFSDTKEDWEDHFASVRTAWTVQQNRFFAKVMKVLQADRLARLSILDTKNEPVQRRLQIDKASKRIRFAFGNIGWDKTLILWLHNLLLEKLRGQLLTSYLEVLQKLKTKIPTLVDRLLDEISNKQGTVASESLAGLLKRNWDPVSPSINQQKFKKLPDNPLLLLIPGSPMSPNLVMTKRHKFWQNQLASMGKVINILPVMGNPNRPLVNCVESIIAATRSKILEMKGHFPGRLIVLIGWNIGALVALHVSLVEAVHAVVCLGFPTMGISGNRGEVDDPIYSCKTPTFFVVGQHASATNLDCLEDIREKLRVETGLLLVGGADDQLRMCRAKKRTCSLTQLMVDRCIMEEMFEFLGNTLFQVMVQPENKIDSDVIKNQAKKRKHKESSIAAGSQTFDNIVKQPKKIRSLKVTNSGTPSFTSHAHDPTGKKAAPRKRLGKASTDGHSTGQKPFMHLTLPMIASTPTEKPTTLTTSLSEAAAIASAPELSTLLQSIKTSSEQALASATKSCAGPLISSKISSTEATSLLASSSSNTPTTTALTLSKFLASTNFLKCVPSGALGMEDPVASLDSKSNSDPLSDIDLEELSGKEDSAVKSQPQLVSQPHPPQILIRAGLSSAPFSIPLSFSMASKMLKSGASVKFTPAAPSSQQIQQLVTASKSNAATLSIQTQSTQVRENISLPKDAAAINSRSVISLDKMSQSSGSLGKSDICSSYLTTISDMPKASVISMGNDTVYLKENPPSKTSAPGTVSIDLGQIASGNISNAVKLQSSSRISLIPSFKSVSHMVSASSSTSSSLSSSPERAPLSSPVPFSQGNQQVTSLSKPVPMPRLSSAVRQPLSTSHSIQATAPMVLQTSSQIGLPSLCSSKLLSTLSSGSGIIKLKVTPQVEMKTFEPNKQSSQGSDETDGTSEMPSLSSDPFAKSAKIPSFIDLTEDSPPSSKQGVKTVTTLAGTHTLSLLSIKKPGLLSSGSSLKMTTSQFTTQTVVSSNPLDSQLKVTSSANTEAISSPKEVSKDSLQSDLKLPTEGQEKKSALQVETQGSNILSSPSLASPSSSHSSKTQTSPVVQSYSTKSNKSSISYAAQTKPVVASVASTRTRRIKAPKQYDL